MKLLNDNYLSNAIDEIQAMYCEPVDIPDWLIENIKTEGGFVQFAKAIKLQQEAMAEYHDDHIDNWDFGYRITEEMINYYNNNNQGE